MLGRPLTCIRKECFWNKLYLLFVWRFPEDYWIGIFINPIGKTLRTELTHRFVVNIEVTISLIDIMRVIWFIAIWLQNGAWIGNVLCNRIVLTLTLYNALEIVVQYHVISTSCESNIQAWSVDRLEGIIQECLSQVVLATLVLKVYSNKHIGSFKVWNYILASDQIYKLVASVEVIVKIRAWWCVASEAQAANWTGIVINLLTLITILLPAWMLKTVILRHHW